MLSLSVVRMTHMQWNIIESDNLLIYTQSGQELNIVNSLTHGIWNIFGRKEWIFVAKQKTSWDWAYQESKTSFKDFLL